MNKEGEIMELETSKKILKVFGIINIVFGIIGALFGVLFLAGGTFLGIGIASKSIEATQNMESGMIALGFGGVLMVIFSAIDIIEGIFDCRAASDVTKVMPAWVFALISLVCSIYSIVSLVMTKNFTTSNLIGAAIGVVLSIITFMAANSIKRAAGK